ncbi:MAG: isoprenylcysteine carboxylmethyltransferase family protein [Bacteroidota bacterium]
MTPEKFDIRKLMFRARSYTPIPFLILMVIFARPTVPSIVIGFAIVLLGECIRFWGVSIAGAETRTTGTVGGTYLITIGPFAYVRNPLYVGNMLVYLGVGVMSMAVFPWLLLLALGWFYLQYSLIITGEEEYLRVRFGEQYSTYCREVRRFIPRLAPYRPEQPPPKTVDVREGIGSEKRTLQAIGLVTAAIVLIYLFR